MLKEKQAHLVDLGFYSNGIIMKDYLVLHDILDHLMWFGEGYIPTTEEGEFLADVNAFARNSVMSERSLLSEDRFLKKFKFRVEYAFYVSCYAYWQQNVEIAFDLIAEFNN